MSLYKKILLTQEKHALVDSEIYDHLMQWKWQAMNSYGTKYYAVRFATLSYKKESVILLHRFIMNFYNKEFKFIDHINGNGLDNRLINLRATTTAQNAWNSKISSRNTSGYKGVSQTNYGKWVSSITAFGKTYYLGLFEDPIDAAIAYNKAAVELYGEYACLNGITLE